MKFISTKFIYHSTPLKLVNQQNNLKKNYTRVSQKIIIVETPILFNHFDPTLISINVFFIRRQLRAQWPCCRDVTYRLWRENRYYRAHTCGGRVPCLPGALTFLLFFFLGLRLRRREDIIKDKGTWFEDLFCLGNLQ